MVNIPVVPIVFPNNDPGILERMERQTAAGSSFPQGLHLVAIYDQ
jgi:hypothetical protein